MDSILSAQSGKKTSICMCECPDWRTCGLPLSRLLTPPPPFLSALRLLDEPIRFDPCCLMSPPPPPFFPPPPQLWKRGIPVRSPANALSHNLSAWCAPSFTFKPVCLKDYISMLEPSVGGGEEQQKRKTRNTWGVFAWTSRTSWTPGPRRKAVFQNKTYHTMF